MAGGYGKYLSETYDTLNSDIDYEKWADFYEACFEKYAGAKVKHICEMACGTGSMAVIFGKRGYSVTAFDLSEDMLTLADKKVQDAGLENVRLTMQDMCSFRVYSKAQGIVCMLDSLNCLMDNNALSEAFECAYAALDDGGVFIFDVNTKYKFENVYGDNAYVLEDEKVLLAWQNFYNKNTKKCDFYLTFFLEDDDGRYTRFDEHNKQKMHVTRTLDKLLYEAGFKVEARVSDFDFTNADEKCDERIYYICTKN